jgi:hypothetical protein
VISTPSSSVAFHTNGLAIGNHSVKPTLEPSAPEHHTRAVLHEARRWLQRRALELAALILVAYVVLKLIPALKLALRTLEHASWAWILALLALEVLSEMGFVCAWSAIVDPDNVLAAGERGRRMDQRLAWLQLGGGLVVPGGSWGGIGIDALILHRLGMPNDQIAERQLNLSFLNTAVDALVVIAVGVGLATGILAGEGNILLTLLPAALAGSGVIVVTLIARRAGARAKRLETKHGKIASTLSALAAAVEDTRRLLFTRGAWTPVLGVLAYLGCARALVRLPRRPRPSRPGRPDRPHGLHHRSTRRIGPPAGGGRRDWRHRGDADPLRGRTRRRARRGPAPPGDRAARATRGRRHRLRDSAPPASAIARTCGKHRLMTLRSASRALDAAGTRRRMSGDGRRNARHDLSIGDADRSRHAGGGGLVCGGVGGNRTLESRKRRWP